MTTTDPTPTAPLQRRLGRSGLSVSVVGLGCNNLGRAGTATADLEGTRAVVHAAVDAGITLFDVADVYGREPGLSEELLGAALDGLRDDVVVATKFGMDARGLNGPDHGARGSRRYLARAVEGSLRRLRTDRIDLLQLHTPDPETPIEETLSALDALVRDGKVRYVGHSNHAGWQIAHAEHVARALGTERIISSQSHYNLLDRRAELEVVPAARAFGLGVLPYFPLANGLLTGKYTRDHAPADGRLSHAKPQLLERAPWEALEAFADLAGDLGMPPVALAFWWLAALDVVASVIAGATRPDQVRENAGAVRALDGATLARLDEIFPPAEKIALF